MMVIKFTTEFYVFAGVFLFLFIMVLQDIGFAIKNNKLLLEQHPYLCDSAKKKEKVIEDDSKLKR